MNHPAGLQAIARRALEKNNKLTDELNAAPELRHGLADGGRAGHAPQLPLAREARPLRGHADNAWPLMWNVSTEALRRRGACCAQPPRCDTAPARRARSAHATHDAWCTPAMARGAVRRLVARAHVTSGAFRCHTASQETPPHTRVARGACAAPHHPSSARARARVSTRSFSRCAVAEGGPSGGAKRRRRPARSRGAPRPPSARARASTRRSRDERAKRLEGIASKIGGFVRTRAAHERLAGRPARSPSRRAIATARALPALYSSCRDNTLPP